jgi:UDP-sugar transporter A1/2/3
MASAAESKDLRLCGVPMKWVSLVSLTLQTSAQVFIIKWARNGTGEGRPAYLASTVVLGTEVVKTVASFLLVAVESGGLASAWDVVRTHFTRNYGETLKVCVPSLLYTVQNNLMFFSLLKLSGAVQQITYQLKILTTAILSVTMLGKVLDGTKWSALCILLTGVLMVQWPRGSGASALTNVGFDPDALLGFFAVIAACFTSGFASVYLEKLLKQTDASIWVRNVQLGAFGSLMAAIVAMSQDGAKILEGGLTQGYSLRVVCVILTNALGGLLCAAVLKYADNILRCFSTALSIILTCVLSACVLQEYTPDLLFVIGACLAICATFLYSVGANWELLAALRGFIGSSFPCHLFLLFQNCRASERKKSSPKEEFVEGTFASSVTRQTSGDIAPSRTLPVLLGSTRQPSASKAK